jgi:hypothetical protein
MLVLFLSHTFHCFCSRPHHNHNHTYRDLKTRYFPNGAVSCWDCIASVMNEYLRDVGGMILRRQFRNTKRGICSNAKSATTNPAWTDVRSKPDLRGDRPTAKLLSHIYLDFCHAGIYRNYHKTVNILRSVCMIWRVYGSFRPYGRECNCLLCLFFLHRHTSLRWSTCCMLFVSGTCNSGSVHRCYFCFLSKSQRLTGCF